MARYRITHDTDYHYSAPVPHSQQLLHLQPRPLAYQHILSQQLHITPPPTRETADWDFFGNPCTHLEFTQPHLRLSVSAETHIEVMSRQWPEFAASAPWEQVVEHCRYTGDPLGDELLAALVFRQESPFGRIKHLFADFAADCFLTGRPLLEATNALMLKIHSEFTFDAEATQIATPLAQVLEERRGVCQDFAHLMMSCLRSLGLPARYVSGYLLTEPPPGQERLIGADASHAWVSVYCPALTTPADGAGERWVDFDPTNAVLPGEQHITLGWGRDFSDVSPLRGVILGGGAHELVVRVTVMPE
ncbi:MAG: transglutaminase family protein [Moraxellaceae bacterium]|nr:transglutaminase family protein [Moraxellaceae bacterium]